MKNFNLTEEERKAKCFDFLIAHRMIIQPNSPNKPGWSLYTRNKIYESKKTWVLDAIEEIRKRIKK